MKTLEKAVKKQFYEFSTNYSENKNIMLAGTMAPELSCHGYYCSK